MDQRNESGSARRVGQKAVTTRPCAAAAPRKYLTLLLCGFLSVASSWFIVRALRTISYPYEWSTMDGYFLYYGSRLVNGLPIYFSYELLSMPFEYVPVYPAIIGILAKLFGLGVWYERAFSLACSLAVAALIGRVVFKTNRNLPSAFCAGLLFLAPGPLAVWHLVRGIDALAALLGLAAIALVAGANPDRMTWRVFVAAVLLVLAFYTKQTALFAAATVIAYLLSQRFRCGIVTGGAFAVACGLLFLLLQSITGGWFYENAFVTTSSNPFLLSLLMQLLRDFCLVLFAAIPVAAAQALRSVKRANTIWTYYFIFALLAALLAGKMGAALSYFIPLFTAVCINTGLWLGDTALYERRPRVFVASLVLLIIQALAFLRNPIPAPNEEDYQKARSVDAYIKERPGPILTERIDSFAVLNGRELSVEAVQLPFLVARRKYDPIHLINTIERKEFSLIIYSGVYFGGIPALKHAIFENYREIDRVPIGLFVGPMTFSVLAPGSAPLQTMSH
ncbi:hypothetical protein HZA56_13380 [Candidatus Poribacteria bacterium]|nr:hypothetical protein [Candidatus Poribacteria bacterium]